MKKSEFRNYLLFLFGINSGLRISDILSLKVKDVQDVDYIEIKEQKTQKYKKFPVNYTFKKLLDNFTKNKYSEEWLFKSKKGNFPITRIQLIEIYWLDLRLKVEDDNACWLAKFKFLQKHLLKYQQ